MRERFTKEQRQQIVEDFAKRNGGIYDAAAFLGEVQQVGRDHPAYDWFEWNNNSAARSYRVEQARAFAQGLIVRFEVETVKRGNLKVLVGATAPAAFSPMAQRRHGGGYVITDVKDPDHMAELCAEAARTMSWFIRRFEAAIVFSGGNVAMLQEARGLLEIASSVSQPEAAE